MAAFPSLAGIALALLLQQVGDHPVPLPADFDAAKCVECHANKQEGKHVHTAISMGCATCHTVETKEDSTKIGLTAPAGELCTTCHEQAKEATLHGPYEQKRCVVCHDPHSSEFNAQTRAPGNALCLACHGMRSPKGDAVEVFAAQELRAEEFRQIPKIVLDRSQRFGHPVLEHPVAGMPDPLRKNEAMSCLSCHRPHAAPLPKLLAEPWKEIAVCDQCHDAAKAGKQKKKEKEKP